MGARAPVALTIAGSDSSGGAGVQADLKTFSALGVYGASVITALTAQNTLGVQGVMVVPSAFVTAQIDSVAADLPIGALKTGMLADRQTVAAVCAAIRHHRLRPLVVDPVMVATSGDPLLAPDAVEEIRNHLIPLAELITPNLHEAARLLDAPLARTIEETEQQARALLALGSRAVLVKGGHASGPEAIDVLAFSDHAIHLPAPRLATRAGHGTGCTLSAAITALLAGATPIEEAVRRAKTFVWKALSAADRLGLGAGSGPVDHLFAIREQRPPV